MIETPKDSREKYKYDDETGRFILKKLLPAGMCFPYDFGFIPGTRGEDGDPIDALVISEFRTFPGCVVECRIIGAMKAEQAKKGKRVRNDRFFFVPNVSQVYKDMRSINDLPRSFINEVLFFFVSYNEQKGKDFNVLGVLSADKARKLLKETMNGRPETIEQGTRENIEQGTRNEEF